MTRSCSHQHGHVKYAEFHRWHIWKYVSTSLRVQEAVVGHRCASTERWKQICNREVLELQRETSRRVLWKQVSQIVANRSEWQKIVSGRCWDKHNCSLQSILNLKLNTSFIQIVMVGGIEIAAYTILKVVRKLVCKWVNFRNKFLWNKNKMLNFNL